MSTRGAGKDHVKARSVRVPMDEVRTRAADVPPTWQLADELAAEYPELPAAQLCWVADRAYLAAAALGEANPRTIGEFARARLDAARARNASAARRVRPPHR